jgi:hypothetical protein
MKELSAALKPVKKSVKNLTLSLSIDFHVIFLLKPNFVGVRSVIVT